VARERDISTALTENTGLGNDGGSLCNACIRAALEPVAWPEGDMGAYPAVIGGKFSHVSVTAV